MNTLGRLATVQEFEDIIIKTKQGEAAQSNTSTSVVRLKDIARLELGAQQYDQICQLDGMPSVAPNVVPMIFSMFATPASIWDWSSFG